MQYQDWMFDKRVVDRNIRRGIISRADYEKYLKGLSDVADNVAEEEPLESEEETAEAE